MKRKALLVLVTTFLFAFAFETLARSGDWFVLGKKRVANRMDRDEIHVGAREGEVRRILLEVDGRAVEFHRVKVVFGNGEDFEADIRQVIPAGGRTRSIDLPGGGRVIKHVVLWYDAQGRGRPPLVTVLGKED